VAGGYSLPLFFCFFQVSARPGSGAKKRLAAVPLEK
jgi:hypothetical protein